MSLPVPSLGSPSPEDAFLPPGLGLLASPLDAGSGNAMQAWDPVDAYFECITTCSLEDGECVTQCVQILRDNG